MNATVKKIQVMLVEDDEDSLVMVEQSLKKESDLLLTGHAKDKQSALEMAKKLKPDVVVCDINLTPKDDQFGVNVAIELSLMMPNIKIIMLSGFIDEDAIRSTMGIGAACNYILKSDPDKLTEAIRDAYDDIPNIDAAIVGYIMKDYRECLKSTMAKLTPHHIKILELFYRGYSVENVAEILSLEVQSVRNLRQEIAKRCLGWKWRLRKLTSTELAQRAKKLGIF
ncbi:response regulator transcription factor [Paenibacillus polymyxa]|uniref:response regulator transcription factor n=1 Tax=Paenibacillus polymyxa TaxID=1406 RepID=UPI0001E6D6A8|nr:response regulator transcription factor [Paenibacillus polymyxa]WPQ59887.1 response regulator transcription factor [Paenibacillus polymyxa]